MFLNFLGRYRDAGLLVLRLGLGGMFVWPGAPKIAGGPAAWGKLGTTMGIFGIHLFPAFWGFMAAVAEFFGGLAIFFGFFTREFCVLLVLDMIAASAFHFNRGDGLFGAAHAIEVGFVFLGLIFIGPGRYSLEKLLFPGKGRDIDV